VQLSPGAAAVNDRTPAAVRFPHTTLAGPKYSAVSTARYLARIAAAGDAAAVAGGKATPEIASPPIAAAKIIRLMRIDAGIQPQRRTR
jgi:hypothetical protein